MSYRGPVYEVGAFFAGEPAISDLLLKVVVARNVDFPDDFAGSVGQAESAPDASTAFDIKVNAVSVGTITFASGVTTATFVTAAAGLSLVVGDRLEIHSPADINVIADVSIMLSGTR